MEPVILLIGGLVVAVSTTVAALIEKYGELQSKNVEAETLRQALVQYASTYDLENCDVEIIDKCRHILVRHFNGRYKETLESLKSMEEKKNFICEVALELSKAMKVDIGKVEFEELDLNTFGYANREEGLPYVVLNEYLLIADPRQLVQTLCHELRHCMQYQAINNNVWGYSPQRVAQWLQSLSSYVPCVSNEAYDAYTLQIIEIDAEKYALTIISK